MQQCCYFLDGKQPAWVFSSRPCGPARGIAEWQLECAEHSGCIPRRFFHFTLSFLLLYMRRTANWETQAMYSWRVWVLAQIELDIAGFHAS